MTCSALIWFCRLCNGFLILTWRTWCESENQTNIWKSLKTQSGWGVQTSYRSATGMIISYVICNRTTGWHTSTNTWWASVYWWRMLLIVETYTRISIFTGAHRHPQRLPPCWLGFIATAPNQGRLHTTVRFITWPEPRLCVAGVSEQGGGGGMPPNVRGGGPEYHLPPPPKFRGPRPTRLSIFHSWKCVVPVGWKCYTWWKKS